MKRTIRKLLMLATCWILLGLAGCGKATPWPSTGCPQITQPYFGPAGNVYNCESRTESVATDSSSKDICNVQCQVFGAAHCPYPPDGYASFEFNTTSMTGDPAPDNGSVGSLASLTTSLQCFLVPVKGVCPESSLPVVEQLGDPASQEYRVRCIPVDRPADAETSTGDDATMVMPETTCEEAVPQDVVEHGTEEEHDEFSEFSTTKIPRCQSCETDADCEGDLQCHNEACGLPEAGLAGATCACAADCAQGLICKDGACASAVPIPMGDLEVPPDKMGPDFEIITGSGSYPATGPVELPPKTGKPTLVVLRRKASGTPVYATLTDGKPVALSADSTAEMLVLMHPVVAGLSSKTRAALRDRAREHPDFAGLSASIAQNESSLKARGLELSPMSPVLYPDLATTAAGILKDVLTYEASAGKGKKVSAIQASECMSTPVDAGEGIRYCTSLSGELLIGNGKTIYRGIRSTSGGAAGTDLLDAKEALVGLDCSIDVTDWLHPGISCSLETERDTAIAMPEPGTTVFLHRGIGGEACDPSDLPDFAWGCVVNVGDSRAFATWSNAVKLLGVALDVAGLIGEAPQAKEVKAALKPIAKIGKRVDNFVKALKKSKFLVFLHTALQVASWALDELSKEEAEPEYRNLAQASAEALKNLDTVLVAFADVIGAKVDLASEIAAQIKNRKDLVKARLSKAIKTGNWQKILVEAVREGPKFMAEELKQQGLDSLSSEEVASMDDVLSGTAFLGLLDDVKRGDAGRLVSDILLLVEDNADEFGQAVVQLGAALATSYAQQLLQVLLEKLNPLLAATLGALDVVNKAAPFAWDLMTAQDVSFQIPGACVSSCAGKECGEDPCDGTCGTCAQGRKCNDSGHCICDASACGLHETCENDQCACEPGFSDCDGAPGCEADLDAPVSCGSCDNVCESWESCVSEACEPENPEVLVDPAQVDFGTAKMGESVERAVKFTNHTGGVATLNCTVQGGVFHADCPATLTEGEIRTVALTFSSPATSSATTYSGKLTVDYSSAAATGTAVVMLSGSSVGKALALVAQPDSLGFGAVKVGKSKTKSVSIVLTGDGSLVPDTVEIPGGPFEVVDDGCSKHQLASTSVNSCSVGIRFKPMETGDHEGTLTVSAKAVTVQVALSGTGDPVCTDACVGDERQCWGQGQVRICVQSGDCRTWKTESCGGGEICVSPGECVSCGGSGQPCCESGCNSGLSCTSGKCVQSTPCSTSFTWSAGIKASGQGIGAVEVTWNPAPDKLEPCVDHYAVLRFLGGPPPPGGYSLSCGPSTETSCLVGETSGTSLVDDGLPPGKHFFWGLYPVKPDGKLGPIQGFAGATVPN